VAAVARQYDVATSRIYKWLRTVTSRRAGFAEVVVVRDEPVAASAPVVPPAKVELAIAGKVRLRIPPSTPPTLAAAIVKALGFHDPGAEPGSDLASGRPDRYAARDAGSRPAGSGDTGTGSACWRPLCFPGAQRQSDQDGGLHLQSAIDPNWAEAGIFHLYRRRLRDLQKSRSGTAIGGSCSLMGSRATAR
jgi:hypothetical protein